MSMTSRPFSAFSIRGIQPLRLIMWFALMALAISWILPFIWMVSTSFKPQSDVMTRTVQFLPKRVTLDNYKIVMERPVWRWMWNSFYVTTILTVGNLLFGALTGYALARLNFIGRNFLFLLLIGSLMIPSEMTMVPLLVAFLKLKMANTYTSLILPWMANVFTVYLFRQFFINFPVELEDAAAIDGASLFRTFWSVSLPLARSTIIAAAVLDFTSNWNAFLWPLLITFSDDMKTLPVGMAIFSPAAIGMTQLESFAPAMAAMTILAVPSLVVFMVLQRFFMEGVIFSGIKG